MPADEGRIRARFWVTEKAVTIMATFHDARVTIHWPVADEQKTRSHVKTLISHLDEVVERGIAEAFIQSQANGLDGELDQLFPKESDD